MEPPPSPCIAVCALDEHDICMGCFRSADEITDWFMATAVQKRGILQRAHDRREKAGTVRLD